MVDGRGADCRVDARSRSATAALPPSEHSLPLSCGIPEADYDVDECEAVWAV